MTAYSPLFSFEASKKDLECLVGSSERKDGQDLTYPSREEQNGAFSVLQRQEGQRAQREIINRLSNFQVIFQIVSLLFRDCHVLVCSVP